MNEDQLIEVLQGVKAGRKWGIRLKLSDALIEQASQEIESLCRCVGEKDVKRIELMPLPKEIMFNGVMISAPLRVAPAVGAPYWLLNLHLELYCSPEIWEGLSIELRWLERGLIHLTAEAAAKHGKAMTGAA